MRRLHLIEIHEQPWCPKPIRDGVTDYIQFMANLLGFYRGAAPLLADALTKTGDETVVDLCSGGGGPWILLSKDVADRLRRPLRILLTDLFPNQKAFAYSQAATEQRIAYSDEAVDATAVPPHLTGFRTLFTSFHHFKPDTAAAILCDAVVKRQGIGIFEITERRPLMYLLEVLGSLSIFLVAPFIRPFRWSRILFTYLVPMLPLALLFDSVVSCLRSYTPNEMRALTQQAGGYDYEWQIGKVKAPGIGMWITYLIGCPK